MEHETKVLVKRVSLKSKDLTQIDDTLLRHLKESVENRCDTCGFITKVYGVESRSRGITDTNSFSGDVNFDVWFQADVVKVDDGDILLGCTVTLISPPGIFLEKNKFIKVFINSKYLPSDFAKTIKVNQKLNVYVMKSNCDLSRTQIDVLGRIHYYAEVPLVNRMVALLGMKSHSGVEKFLDIVTRDDKDVIDNLCELGYLPKIRDAKKEIDEIPEKVWKFYRSLLNPLELVYSPSGYSTYRIKPKNDNVPVPSRAYFKLWEIINKFDVVGVKDQIVVANLCEAPGGFVKALIDYRGMRGLGKKDQYYVVTLQGKDTIGFSKELLSKYKSQITLGPSGCNCDLTREETLNGCIKAFSKTKADLITADGGIKTSQMDFEEEKETGVLKASELVTALSIQKEDGVFVWKLFDTCTRLTADLLYIINQYYTDVVLYKPETSRPANSERYVVATKFTGIKSGDLEALKKIVKEHKKYLVSVVSEEERASDAYVNFVRELKVFNGRLMETQYKKIRETLNMIKFKDLKIIGSEELKQYQDRQKMIANNWARKNDLDKKYEGF